jgi:hypothetical protein
MSTATTRSKTVSRRQAAFDEAETTREGIEVKRATLRARHGSLTREIGELQVRRQALLAEIEASREAQIAGAPAQNADEAREELRALDAEIAERAALLQTVERQTQAFSEAAGTAQADHWHAALALQREPVETALHQIADTLQQLERDWSTAGRLAAELEISGDQWGRNVLRDLLAELTNIHLVGRRNAPFEIEVPEIPALRLAQ